MLAVGQIIAFLSRALRSHIPGCICLRIFPHRLSRPSPGVPSLDIYPGPDITSAAPTLTSLTSSRGFPDLDSWARVTGHWSQEEDSSLLQYFYGLRRRRCLASGLRSWKSGEWVCDHNSRVSTWSARWVYLNELDPKNGNHKSKIIPLAAKNVWFNIFRSKMLRGIFSSILSSMIWKIS